MAGYIKPVDSSKDEITCSICLQIFTYPITLTCSHSFCLRCIQDHLKHKTQDDNYMCPECHVEFAEKPRLLKNSKLAEDVEKLSKCQERRTVCDYCFEEDVPAAMSCIQCETFFCVTHLRPHSEKPSLKDHVLVDPTEARTLRKCVEHKETLKLYCKQDRASGQSPLLGQVKPSLRERMPASHGVFTRWAQFLDTGDVYWTIARLSRLEHLGRNSSSSSGSKSIKAATSTIPISESEVSSMEEENPDVLTAFLVVLRGRLSFTEKLKELNEKRTKTEEAVKRLRELNAHVLGANCNEYRINSLLNKQKLVIHDTVVDDGKLSSLIKSINKLFNSLSKNDSSVRKALLAYATTVTFDPVTANENLILSEDRTIVRYTDAIVKAPYSPKRFDDTLYVLGSQGYTFGNHYWEVVVKSKSDWEIGVAYSSIPRKGKCWLGRNNVSWSLERSSEQYTVWHNNIPLKVNMKGKLERVGVYLNYPGGVLAFYDAETMTLLVPFYHKFTEALYPILNPCNSKGGNFAPLTVLQLKGI
ncbi:E3 ubiquitin-protein ligase TRIM69-like [Rhincodon typus]|uniref:E3 ubiquitin-protein ligase TRIM69-like n=1 Tax=Rhincodon typus TaxID=259920 RepID=UPI00202EC847|nr:E3 ubiquitin-protein ligase TRIM69-like [Rhincodon typus]